MRTEHSGPTPTEIALQKNKCTLKITFDESSHFELPSRYLRVFSPAAEARIARDRGEEIVTPDNVSIEQIEPVGSYAVRLVFSDGHETGVYSWATLYQLGKDLDRNWPLQKPVDAETRNETGQPHIDDKDISQWRTINILYFGALETRLSATAKK